MEVRLIKETLQGNERACYTDDIKVIPVQLMMSTVLETRKLIKVLI